MDIYQYEWIKFRINILHASQKLTLNLQTFEQLLAFYKTCQHVTYIKIEIKKIKIVFKIEVLSGQITTFCIQENVKTSYTNLVLKTT